ncbi:MAG: pyruvate formate lyase-activating protein [Acidobacteria bacterium]|nr:pyruvate formate lyase-activating protein [Acidobacteriota bacterium]
MSQRVNLEAPTPYELRTGQGIHVSEQEVQAALVSGDLGFFHSFTTGSTLDGPGVRIVAWLTGCQFKCLYCHNPDTWKMTNGIPVPLARAVSELRKYRHGLNAMRGGLTISGGEPLMQHKFVCRLFEAAKQLGIHTALDTNGALGHRLTDEQLRLADLVLLDIKSWTPERHQRLVSAPVEPVLDFARRLAAASRPMWLRYVFVPGHSDDYDDIARIAEFARSLGSVQRVDVLPFHQMGGFKWKELGMAYALANVEPPHPSATERACQIFRAAGLKAL